MATIIVTYLRRERRKWGLTQQDLTFALGLKSRASISRIEHGLCPPTASELLALQRFFGMTAAQLFPQLAATADDMITRNTAILVQTQKINSTRRAQQRTTFLRQTLSRAVIH